MFSAFFPVINAPLKISNSAPLNNCTATTVVSSLQTLLRMSCMFEIHQITYVQTEDPVLKRCF